MQRDGHPTAGRPGASSRAHDALVDRGAARMGLVLAVAFVVLGLARHVSADQIVTAAENYRGAMIVGFEDGEVRLRTSRGRLRSEWVDQIKLMVVDRGGLFDDFNQAERFFADGEPARAIVRYRRTIRLTNDFWSDLIAARLVLACDAARQLDTAVLNWIRLLEGSAGGPVAAARLIPREIPKQQNQRVTRAIQQLDSALASDPEESHRALIEILRYEILRRTDDEHAAQAAARATNQAIPSAARTAGVYDILLHALRALLAGGTGADALRRLDRTIADCPDSTLPGFLLLKGEVLFEAAVAPEDFVRAAWPMMRVPIHFPDDPRAAEGLLGAARVMDRLGNTQKADDLLRECLAHAHLTDGTRRAAEALRARVSSEETPTED